MKKLYILSIFKNCHPWISNIMVLMFNAYQYNESLDNNKGNKLHMNFSFLDGHSNDGTYEFLEGFCKRFRDVKIVRFEPSDDQRFKRLAEVRNYLLGQTFSSFSINDDDYVLFMDSDVKFGSNLIYELIKDMDSSDADIIAPMVFVENFREFANSYFYDILAFRSLNGDKFSHFSPYLDGMDNNRPNEIGSVGSFYLMKGRVAKNVRYTGNSDSEQVEFCNHARSKGFKIFITPRIGVLHINFERYNMGWH